MATVSKTLKIGLSDADKTTMSNAVLQELIPAYSSSSTYQVLDFVYYSGAIYKCTTAITTAEAWDSTKWASASLKDALDYIKSKANVDGIYPLMWAGTSGTSENLTATKGLTVAEPFSFGITGLESASSVGDGNATLGLRGNSVPYAQLLSNGNFESTSGWLANGTLSVSDNVATFTAGVQNGAVYKSNTFVTGQTYLACVWIKTDAEAGKIRLLTGFGSAYNVASSSRQFLSKIFTYASESTTLSVPSIVDARSSDWTAIEIEDFQLFPLTQLGISATTEDEAISALRANGIDPYVYNAYSAGAIRDSKSTSIISRNRNQWDGNDTTSSQYKGHYVQNGASSSYSITANNNYNLFEIRVLPEETYYFGKYDGAVFYGAGIVALLDGDGNVISGTEAGYNATNFSVTTPANCKTIRFSVSTSLASSAICINISGPNFNGTYEASKKHEYPITMPVMRSARNAYDTTEKVNVGVVNLWSLEWVYASGTNGSYFYASFGTTYMSQNGPAVIGNISTGAYIPDTWFNVVGEASTHIRHIGYYTRDNDGLALLGISDDRFTDANSLINYLQTNAITMNYELKTPTDQTESDFSFTDTIAVYQNGTLEFVNDGTNLAPQGNEIFYQKNIKTFVEAFGEAIDWNPDRITRLAKLSFTPETADITLNPSPDNAYAKVQVMSGSFTIVISAALTGEANGTISFSDSEIDLSSFETEPASAIYDMDGKTVAEAPTTVDCNIASFIGRSKTGTIMWSLLHSGTNKVKVHFEESVPLDSNGDGKIDCRASLML